MKSVVQIAVLLLLVIVGVGAYLYQQDQLGFITQFFEDEKPTAPVVVQPTKRPAPKPVAPAADAGPSIPAHPAKGQLRGAPFAVERSEIESGVLTLKQGKPPLDTEITIFLFTRPWEVPAGRSFKLMDQKAAPEAPHIRVRWHEAGQSAPRQREFTEGYTLLLELGQEKDKQVPGKIYLKLPDEEKSVVAGTFDAHIQGFRLVNGEPDLSVDSVDTLQFLALRDIVVQTPNRELGGVQFRNGHIDTTPASGGAPTGYLEVQYRLDSEPVRTQKFQFVKEEGGWRVLRRLRPDQLEAAHPVQAPNTKAEPAVVFPYLAARRVEAELQRRQADRLVTGAQYTVKHSDAHKVGVCEVSYKIGDGQMVQTAYLFRRGTDGWSLVRELNKKERLNLATGKVELQR